MENNVLVYAATDETGYGSGIFLLDEIFYQPIKIAERDGIIAVKSLASHDNILYDSWWKVEETLSGNGSYSKIDKLYGRPHQSHAIASHNGKFYESSADECLYERFTGDALEEILREADGDPTFPHYSQENILMTERFITDLVSHKEELYDCGNHGVFETFSEESIADRTTYHMASNDDILYGSGPDASGIYDGTIYEILTDKKIAKRSDEVRSLVSHNGRLYDAGNYGILDTMINQIREDSIVPHTHISAMASVPRKIFEEVSILKTNN
jgi:hypothetical protein